MAYIKNIRITKTIRKAIEYVTDEKDVDNAKEYITRDSKTQNGALVDCNFGDWRNADNLWENTRKKYGKNDKVLAHHFVQSFDPIHGVTPEEAHRIGMELAEKQFGSKGFDFIVATHVDKNHIHNHILVNNVARTGARAGMKYYHNNNTYRYIRRLNIDTCRNHGIPAVDCRRTDEAYIKLHGIDNREEDNPFVDVGEKYKSASYIKTPAYDSWKEAQLTNKAKVRKDMNDVINESASWGDFIKNMEEKGYDVKWQTKRGEDRKYITYLPKGAQRGVRDRQLGSQFTKEAIIRRIEKNQARRKSEWQEEGLIFRKSKEITYKEISWEFKKKFILLLNPKYIAKKYGLKNYYVPKSQYEQSISEKYYIELYRRAGMQKASEKDYKNVKNIKKKLGFQKDIEALMQKFNIKDTADLSKVKRILQENRNINHSRIEVLCEELLKTEKLQQLFVNRNDYKKIFEMYSCLEGSEQEAYYRKNKIEIQNYKYAERELRMISLDTVKEERENILSKLNGIELENKQLEQEISVLEHYEKLIERGIKKFKGKDEHR